MHSKFSTLWMLCNAYDDMSSFSARSKHQRCYSSDGLTCDASLVVENENLKKEVNKLTHTLAKAYGGEDRLLMCLGSHELLSTKRDWATPLRKVRRPLLLTRLVFWRTMVGFTLVASKLVMKSKSAWTKIHKLMYPPLSLILSMYLPRVQMV